MHWLASICVKRPVFATVIILILVVVGVLGYSRLSVDRFPKMDAPTITITTRLQGASPKEIESDVSDKIEEAVNTIAGIEDLTSTSTEGVSQVTVSFDMSKDINVAAQEVRDRVNRIINDLPTDIDQPEVEKMDPDSAPILVVALVADKPVREVTEYADKVLRRQIESVSGVGQATLLGGQKRQINVWLDPVSLQSRGLTSTDIQQAFNRQNVQIPSGTVKSSVKNQNLRVIGKVQSIDEIRQIIVSEKDGALIRVQDVARVEDGEVEEDSVARLNGVSTVVLSIRRQSGENIINVANAIKERLDDIRKTLPSGYRIDVVRDNSTVILTSTGVVKEHLVLGSIFAALVVLIFLGNSRATIISALSIPTSIIATFGIMWMTNMTINEISLVALALAVGIVIDDTIIVVENIYRRIEHFGESPAVAAVTGTKEIGMAVTATTFSLLAVFLPVAFLGGMVGQFLKSFGMTMSFAIAISLLVSFTLGPSLGARLLRKSSKKGLDSWLERMVNVFYKPLENGYIWILRHALRLRWLVVLLSLATVASIVPLLGHVGKDMMPPNEEAQLTVSLRAPEGTSLQATDLIAERIAKSIRSMQGVEYTLTTIGDDAQGTQNMAGIYVHLTDPAKRSESQAQIIERVRKDLIPQLPSDLRVSVSEVSPFGSGTMGSVQYVVAGPDLDRLSQLVIDSLPDIKKIDGIRDVDTNLNPGKPEITLQPNRAMAGQLGVSVADLSNTLHILVGGLETTTYEEGGEQYDIMLRAEEKFRNDESGLSLIAVRGSGQELVSMDKLVTRGFQEGPAQINRLNRRRQITITANSAPGVDQQTILTQLDAIVAKMNLPSDYSAGPTSMSREVGRTASRFVTTFMLAFVFMYLILAAQFESWIHPFTILLTLPLTLPFALLGLILLGQSFNIFSALGILVLFGVVKKNGILQVDHTNQLREAGMSRLDAIIQANRDRLRPILMTTAAFVAGMMPMMLAKGIGSAFHNATAGVVVGGQTLSLLLTLLAIPVFYSLFDDLIAWTSRIFKKSPAGDPSINVVETGTSL
jgi:hydrophobic/amphiphilic exporter-1 (mainly G- bacteria), HAE1 family